MKFGRISSEKLAAALEKQRKALGLSYGHIAADTNVHSSQVSRICRGEFVTITGNVVQICSRLGVDPHSASLADQSSKKSAEFAEQSLKRRILECIDRLWDRTPEGADRLVRIFDDLVQLARPNARGGFNK